MCCLSGPVSPLCMKLCWGYGTVHYSRFMHAWDSRAQGARAILSSIMACGPVVASTSTDLEPSYRRQGLGIRQDQAQTAAAGLLSGSTRRGHVRRGRARCSRRSTAWRTCPPCSASGVSTRYHRCTVEATARRVLSLTSSCDLPSSRMLGSICNPSYSGLHPE